MRRRGLGALVFIVVFTLAALGYTFAAGNTPFLGLDLQGGVAVVLQPDGDASDEQLEDAVAILRSRVDAIGVAEPEITRRGQTISVEIPGVEDRQQAIDLVGQTGELAFRPVLAERQTGVPVDDADDAPTGDEPSEGDNDGSDEGAWGTGFASGESAAAAQEPAEDDEPTEQDDEDVEELDLTDEIDPELLEELGAEAPAGDLGDLEELTPPEEEELDEEVVLARYETFEDQRVEIARYLLGPASLTGAGLEDARASLQVGQWVVLPTFRGGEEGIDAFNETATECFSQLPTCPTGLFAITLDGEVISALGVETPTFARDQVQISGTFTDEEAQDLATVLRFGALPVELEIEAVQDVSASIGRDALRAGLVAGAIGIALVALYMILFYRILGMTAVAKLALEGGLLWAMIAWLGSTQGLALTLAGVTGIIVAIGLSVDSNVVFYEHVKEDIRNGRSPRSAAKRSFAGAWRTIVKADLASLIAAVLLYALAVGPVRGFAFYLGLATLLDLIVAWFFMRPTVALCLRSKLCARRPGVFGLPELPAGSTPGGVPARPATRDAGGT